MSEYQKILETLYRCFNFYENPTRKELIDISAFIERQQSQLTAKDADLSRVTAEAAARLDLLRRVHDEVGLHSGITYIEKIKSSELIIAIANELSNPTTAGASLLAKLAAMREALEAYQHAFQELSAGYTPELAQKFNMIYLRAHNALSTTAGADLLASIADKDKRIAELETQINHLPYAIEMAVNERLKGER